MALYLPVRAVSRSQQVRIGSQKLSATATSYVDISVTKTRRELQNHQATGALITVGALTATNADSVVYSGCSVVAGTAANSIRLADPLTTTKTTGTAGELRVRSTGLFVTVPVTDSVLITANALGFTRTDLVVVDNTTGVATIVLGTLVGVTPATPAGKTAIASFTVANGGSVLGPITDVRLRP